jgi:hypothetical protein
LWPPPSMPEWSNLVENRSALTEWR